MTKTSLWPKHHCDQNATNINATVTKTSLWPKRHCGQNATQNFCHASNNHRRIFLISFSECIRRMHSTDNIQNMYFYVFGIISLPCLINYLPCAKITNNHLFLVISDYYKLLHTITDNFWLFRTITDYYWLLLTISDYYQLFLTITNYFWLLFNSTGYYWLLLTISDYFWPLLSITE